MPSLPVVFLSHGSPMHAIEPGTAGPVWRALAAALPRPRALLIASAHWETAQPAFTAHPHPETIHDFSGFPDALYRLRYDAPGDPVLASCAMDLARRAGLTAATDGARGLDHGAWAPLLHMYPGAEIPVVQVSVQTERGPRHHLALGAALRPLAQDGVLIIGSGHMTHNLRDRLPPGQAAHSYVDAFRHWIDARVQARDLPALAAYRSNAPHAQRAHPSEEHFLPLFVALGASAPACRVEHLLPEVYAGSLAMDAYVFHPSP
ncbi:MAG: class III extradiol ring-cleavage dioxygenase [Proteobacteria bacterium]|nr:class III extradiol ring-cleavage dioxygenase [Pseudomonadota bacterium]